MPQGGISPTLADQRQVLAAVDLGSNSFHMIVARYEHGQLTVIDKLREMVRLAVGLDQKGRISAEASQRAVECMHRFGQRLSDMHAADVRAVGTNALRKAKNANEFLEQAEEALGHPIDVISGREEARLVYLGAAHSLPDHDGNRLVVDIGGGSTELIVGQRFESLERFSLYMGCVSLTEKYFPKGRLTARRWKRARLAAALELEPVIAALQKCGWDEATGTSGTIRTTMDVLRAHGWSEEGITPQALKQLVKKMLECDSVDELRFEGLSAERAPVFAGGVVILQAVLDGLGIDTMRVARGALREGLIYETIGRLSREDARDRTVAALERRYHVDAVQAQGVELTVTELLAQVSDNWKIDDALSGRLLRWAARLHEIGLGVAHAQYHRHGAYLLENSDLSGFTNREKTLLAALVASHRRKAHLSTFEGLPKPWNRRLPALAVLLRLSVLFHRSRATADLPRIALKAGKRTLAVKLPGGWYEAHPLTRTDLEREIAYLDAIGYQLTLE